MKKIIIFLLVFLLSCTTSQKPNTSKQPTKASTKSKVVKKDVKKAIGKAEKKEVEGEKEDKLDIIENKLGYDTEEERERKEIQGFLSESNEYTWLDRMWNRFKVNRAEDLLKDIGSGRVYRTKESILLVLKSTDITEKVLSELAKIYLLQNGGITIYSNFNLKQKLVDKGLLEEKVMQRKDIGENTVIRLDIGVVK